MPLQHAFVTRDGESQYSEELQCICVYQVDHFAIYKLLLRYILMLINLSEDLRRAVAH